jgi:hypothetical protein
MRLTELMHRIAEHCRRTSALKRMQEWDAIPRSISQKQSLSIVLATARKLFVTWRICTRLFLPGNDETKTARSTRLRDRALKV